MKVFGYPAGRNQFFPAFSLSGREKAGVLAASADLLNGVQTP